MRVKTSSDLSFQFNTVQQVSTGSNCAELRFNLPPLADRIAGSNLLALVEERLPVADIKLGRQVFSELKHGLGYSACVRTAVTIATQRRLNCLVGGTLILSGRERKGI